MNAPEPDWMVLIYSIEPEGGQQGISQGEQARTLNRFGFVDEHDRNPVTDGIRKTALFTEERTAILPQTDFSFALGAGNDIEQFFRQTHRFSSLIHAIMMTLKERFSLYPNRFWISMQDLKRKRLHG